MNSSGDDRFRITTTTLIVYENPIDDYIDVLPKVRERLDPCLAPYRALFEKEEITNLSVLSFTGASLLINLSDSKKTDLSPIDFIAIPYNSMTPLLLEDIDVTGIQDKYHIWSFSRWSNGSQGAEFQLAVQIDFAFSIIKSGIGVPILKSESEDKNQIRAVKSLQQQNILRAINTTLGKNQNIKLNFQNKKNSTKNKINKNF